MLTLEQIHARCEEEGDCWLWPGATINGYPQARIGDKGGQMLRRYIFTVLLGNELPLGRVVASICENRLCCAPAHLFSMTYSKRLRLAYKRGSRNQAMEYIKRRETRRQQGTVLDMEKARQIRAREDEPNAVLAAEFGVHPKTIYSVKAGLTWREHAPNSSVFNFARSA